MKYFTARFKKLIYSLIIDFIINITTHIVAYFSYTLVSQINNYDLFFMIIQIGYFIFQPKRSLVDTGYLSIGRKLVDYKSKNSKLKTIILRQLKITVFLLATIYILFDNLVFAFLLYSAIFIYLFTTKQDIFCKFNSEE
ncbi:MAG: hypothetical protein K8S23_06340 [Candidatus Cloacimonetes bacterium]|nr:hypothetical protein [Candidatus Cloacimonadota bacterium]